MNCVPYRGGDDRSKHFKKYVIFTFFYNNTFFFPGAQCVCNLTCLLTDNLLMCEENIMYKYIFQYLYVTSFCEQYIFSTCLGHILLIRCMAYLYFILAQCCPLIVVFNWPTTHIAGI